MQKNISSSENRSFKWTLSGRHSRDDAFKGETRGTCASSRAFFAISRGRLRPVPSDGCHPKRCTWQTVRCAIATRTHGVEHEGTFCGSLSRTSMTTSTLILIGFVIYLVGGLAGFLLAALLKTAHTSDKDRPTLDASGLHPLDLPTH
jgi:hypothetical protein